MAPSHAKSFTGQHAPVQFFLHGKAFLDAAAREFSAEEPAISIPGYFLVGRAAELALKAYLLSCGATEAELRGIGHDLEDALAAAGDLEIPGDIAAVLRALNPYYSGKDLEYPKTGLKSFPDHDVALAATRSLFEIVGRVVRVAR